MYTAFFSFLWFLIIDICIVGIKPHEFFTMDPHVGILGWLSEEQWRISLFLVAPFWGLLGNGGYIFSLKYFQPHVVANAFLVEPVVGQLLGCILGQDLIPGVLTFIGIAVIMPGIWAVAKGSDKLEEEMFESSELSFEQSLSLNEIEIMSR